MSVYLVISHNGVENILYVYRCPFICKYYINTMIIFFKVFYTCVLNFCFLLKKNVYHYAGSSTFFQSIDPDVCGFRPDSSCDYDVRCATESVHSLIARACARTRCTRHTARMFIAILETDLLSTC